MASGEVHDDRAAILEVVRAYFAEASPAVEELLGGRLLEWGRLRGEPAWMDRFEADRTLESAAIVELGATHAVVEVRTESRFAHVRGTKKHVSRFDGTVVLERVRDRWRIVDLVDAERRVDSLAVGLLAEQANGDVAVRVLGASHGDRAFECVVELVNRTAGELVLEQAFFLRRGTKTWSQFFLGDSPRVAAGETATALLNSAVQAPLADAGAEVGLIVRAGSRKLPFRIDVPFVVPATVVAQPPPPRLPVRRWTITRWLLICTAISVIALAWFGWEGLVAPLLFGAVLYERARIYGKLPEPAYRMRHALDVLVVASVFLLLWFTPAVRLAVPAGVAILTYLLARHVARRSAGFSVVTAMSIGIAWLGLLGTDTGPLSPCRLADGTPAAAADAFVRGLLARTERLTPADVEAGVATRKALSSEHCVDSARGCYRYVSTAVGRFAILVAAVECDGRTWHVHRSFSA